MGSSGGLVELLSSTLGTSQPALRLFLSVLAGYPVASIHRRLVSPFFSGLQHVFFILTGLSIAYFNFGVYSLHHVACVVCLHLTLTLCGGSITSVVVAFVFQLGYLLLGYIFYQTKEYDITWCTSHCVLTLKLIGVAFDVYDGHKDQKLLRHDQRDSALSSPPSLLELAGHALFPCTFVVGPQFSMKLYQDFTCKALNVPLDSGGLPDSVRVALRHLLYGTLYTVVHIALTSLLVPNQYFFDEKFLATGFVHKVVWISVWQRASFLRYLIVWLIAEGSCILIGLTYNGEDGKGGHRWDRLTNINIRLFENAHRFQDYIVAFNINTNNWVAKYVFKRLMFLGNKDLSQMISLLFLAVWHGYHLGYFFTFSLEFIVVYWERKVERALGQYPSAVRYLSTSWRRLVTGAVLRVYTVIFFSYCTIPFLAVSRLRWWPIYRSLYFYGHLLFLSWPLAVPAVHALMRVLGVPRVLPPGKGTQQGQQTSKGSAQTDGIVDKRD